MGRFSSPAARALPDDYNEALHLSPSRSRLPMQTAPQAAPRNRWLKPLAIVIVIAALATAAFFSLYAKASAPNVAFTDLTGKKVTMSDLRGKVVMVNFWATSCVTCIKEMPAFIETYNKYNEKGLDFIAVAMSYDPPNYVLNYAKTRQLPFRVTLDTQGELAKAFGDVQLTPTTFVIDKRGNIIKRYIGEPELAELYKLLEDALAA